MIARAPRPHEHRIFDFFGAEHLTCNRGRHVATVLTVSEEVGDTAAGLVCSRSWPQRTANTYRGLNARPSSDHAPADLLNDEVGSLVVRYLLTKRFGLRAWRVVA